MKCPHCGYEPTRGRPKRLDDRMIGKLRKKGQSLSEIAKKLGVTRGAVQASLKRAEYSSEADKGET